MSRTLRMGIGLVSLIPVIAIAIGGLLAVGVEGAAVGWLALGIGVLWFALMAWWALRAPANPDSGDRKWGVFRNTRMH